MFEAITKPARTHYLWAGLAGLAQALSIAAPWSESSGLPFSGQPFWWLQILSLAVLVGLVNRGPSFKRGLLLGWVFGLAWMAGTFWWLFISMHRYGGLAAPLAVAAVLGLAAFLGAFYGLACGIYGFFRAQDLMKPAQAAIIFAALWTLAELIRGTWLTGFPWGAGGYAQVDGPLAAYASHTGVYGVGFLSSLLAALTAVLLAGKAMRKRVYFAMGLLLALGFARPLLDDFLSPVQGSKLSVTLLQGNIPQEEKFQSSSGVPQALRWYSEQLAASRTQLVVTPETAIALLPAQLPDDFFIHLGQRLAPGSAALVGVPLGSYRDGYTNSVVGLLAGQQPSAKSADFPAGTYQYDKHHLVPFGEFIPPMFKWFTQMMNIPLGDFNRGAVGQASLAFAGQRLAPNICYEDLFGEELAARFIDPTTAPTILVNISNIGWFGNSVAIDQHLHISRMRSLELARPMIRATNTGATAIIDHRGRVTHALARHTRGVLVGEVQGQTDTTPYAWWASRFGLWPLSLLMMAIVLIALRANGKRDS
jgi:apolipoprotein N-acyltransferase